MPMMLLLDTAAIRLALAAMMLVNTLEFYFYKYLDMEKSADTPVMGYWDSSQAMSNCFFHIFYGR